MRYDRTVQVCQFTVQYSVQDWVDCISRNMYKSICKIYSCADILILNVFFYFRYICILNKHYQNYFFYLFCFSYYTKFEGHEIMYHVSTLLPFSTDDIQQVPFILYPVSCILYPISYILYPVSLSCILYFVSCILYPVSCILYHVSCYLYPLCYILYPISHTYTLYPLLYAESISA